MASKCHILVQALLILASLCFTLIKAAPQNSLVTSLPGFMGKFPSKHYSGYVSIGDNVAKEMFYYFVESERNPTKDPVVLWLNGGPLCSSLGGFTSEHGPFRFEASGPLTSKSSIKNVDLSVKLHLNPNSWSKVSNIIYLEAPIGVGFSFSSNTSDYETGDLKTAFETHIFLLKWFRMFPERIGNPFYIAGESYAGIYIPTLAIEIVKGVNSSSRPIINLKGYMIGNGFTDEYYNLNAIVPFAHGKGLISDDLYQDIFNECEGRYFSSNSSSDRCISKTHKFRHTIGHLNEYNILEPCYIPNQNDSGCHNCIRGSSRIFGNFRLEVKTALAIHLRSQHILAWPDSEVGTNISIMCQNDLAPSLWLNNGAVRKAIHAAEENVSGKWEFCSNRVTSYRFDVNSTIGYHKKLIDMGLRVLIYSGDLDMVVPYTGSEAWIRSLGYKVIDEWRPWISNAQVAGYTQGYDKNLTFLTIKGAGHMVPTDKPRETLDFYSRWLAEETV